MKIRYLTVLIIVLLPFLLNGCIGPINLPGPTNKKINSSDVVGTWQYNTDYDEATITLLLNKDGSFLQKIPASELGKVEVCKGKWTLDGSSVLLDKAVQRDFNCKRKTTSYSI